MIYTKQDHTFVVCAYKKSPYLKKCIESLLRQQDASNILISTSPPNDYIESVSKSYGIRLFINDSVPGIGSDWNFAYSKADTPLVTIAHQDDIYDSNFLDQTLKAINRAKNPIISHSSYYEIRNGKKVYKNKLLTIKRIMLLPLIPKFTWNSIFLRRRSLSLGCAICCPSVTYVKEKLPEVPFDTNCKASLDWQAWEKFSKIKGSFCYIKTPIMGHRVHEDSETSNVIGDGDGRTPEDFYMYQKFWPKPIAKFIVKFYSKGQKSNSL